MAVVQHPTHPVMIIPKDQFLALKNELIMFQMDKAEANSKKNYTTVKEQTFLQRLQGRGRV